VSDSESCHHIVWLIWDGSPKVASQVHFGYTLSEPSWLIWGGIDKSRPCHKYPFLAHMLEIFVTFQVRGISTQGIQSAKKNTIDIHIPSKCYVQSFRENERVWMPQQCILQLYGRCKPVAVIVPQEFRMFRRADFCRFSTASFYIRLVILTTVVNTGVNPVGSGASSSAPAWATKLPKCLTHKAKIWDEAALMLQRWISSAERTQSVVAQREDSIRKHHHHRRRYWQRIRLPSCSSGGLVAQSEPKR
jgi:hypothetical protein